MSDIKHGGFAFPQSNPDVAYSDYIGGGMTLRDWFAGQALMGLLPSAVAGLIPLEAWEQTLNGAAANSYIVADAMLAAREVKP